CVRVGALLRDPRVVSPRWLSECRDRRSRHDEPAVSSELQRQRCLSGEPMKKITLTLGLTLALASVAHADNRSKADELEKQGKKLMADKRYSEACPKFEEMFKLDPGIGGEVIIGHCYEEWGKLGRAYRAYTEALRQARGANDRRTDQIQ